MSQKDTIKDILNKLNILDSGNFSDTGYTMDLVGGINEFGTLHSSLTKSDLVAESAGVITAQETRIEYDYLEDDYTIILHANLDKNEASLEIKRNS